MNLYKLTGPVLLALASPGAWAHGGDPGTAWFHGLVHPLGGVDHLLALLAVGLWAAQQGGRAQWVLPLGFLMAMAAGAALALVLPGLPVLELGISGSVLILGALLALGRGLPLPAATALCTLFALVHGHAHGAEMAAGSSVLAYGAGFLAATAALHAVGLAAGRLTALRGTGLRLGGAAIAAAGGLLAVA